MLKKSQRKKDNSINAGSMADIAFLLLIFFLVTTQISEDQGIMVRLPHYEATPPTNQIPPRNLFNVFVNGKNQLLVEDQLASLTDLRERTKEFISNPKKLNSLPSSPRSAIISLQNDRSTSYETYIGVYNELKAAYNELRDERAIKIYSKPIAELPKKEQNKIKKEIPLVISEAELTNNLE